MNNLINLVPDLVKQVPGGIQALLFADRFIRWSEYEGLTEDMGVPSSVETKTFLKLGLIKYAFNLPVIDTLEISSDRASFRNYLSYYSPGVYLVGQVKEPLSKFVSAYGNLGELLHLIDEDLKAQELILERKIKPGTSCLIPYLAKIDPSRHANSEIAMWL